MLVVSKPRFETHWSQLNSIEQKVLNLSSNMVLKSDYKMIWISLSSVLNFFLFSLNFSAVQLYNVHLFLCWVEEVEREMTKQTGLHWCPGKVQVRGCLTYLLSYHTALKADLHQAIVMRPLQCLRQQVFVLIIRTSSVLSTVMQHFYHVHTTNVKCSKWRLISI